MVEYKAQDVAQHNYPGSYWIILHGKAVYDVTSYLNDHPGGKDVLVESAGTDATHDFEFTGHSSTARDALQGFFIGSLAGYTEVSLEPTGFPCADRA
ncbi:cytochrome b5-like heme/steroid binding domain-containing protein [Colletotrichum cereale]|nr:cytochrome b5-like heme/steroid binding domain-containing protein [Colletotrichum cereale]